LYIYVCVRFILSNIYIIWYSYIILCCILLYDIYLYIYTHYRSKVWGHLEIVMVRCGGPKRSRSFTRNQDYFQDRNTAEHHTGTKRTIRHQTNRRRQIKYTGNETQVETQVETIRAWLETIRKETDKHREGRAGKQETRQ